MTVVPYVRVLIAAGVVLVVAGLAAILGGHEEDQQALVRTAVSPRNGVEVGGLLYQSSGSRALDTKSSDDREILSGIPGTSASPGSGREWYGVFVSVSNPGRRSVPDARRFVLVDADGHRFLPERLGGNAYAYRPATVAPGGAYPSDTSVAGSNLTTNGALVLFNIPRASDKDGSLTLQITGPAGGPSGDLAVT